MDKFKNLVNCEEKQLTLIFGTKCFFKGKTGIVDLIIKKFSEKYLKKLDRLQHLDGKEIGVLQRSDP